MKILVTGGAGFIGANYILDMLKAHPEDELVCLDALTYAGNMQTLEGAQKNPRFQFVRGDIAERDAVFSLISDGGFDAVVNFAAESHVDRSIEDPGVFLRTNILGTQTLMDACRAFSVPRFHQVSTDEVYGDLPLDRPDLFLQNKRRSMPRRPIRPRRLRQILLVLAYHRTFGLPATISRCSNNYGPYHFPEKLIPLMITNALQDKPLPVYGEGLNVRDWLFVSDHCAAIDLVLRNGRVGEVYNIGGHNERKNIDVVKTILKHLGKSENLITYVTDRKGHDLRYAIDPAKMQKELGWQPETAFESGIEQTIEWYVNNQTWWKNILSGEYQKANGKV